MESKRVTRGTIVSFVEELDECMRLTMLHYERNLDRIIVADANGDEAELQKIKDEQFQIIKFFLNGK